MILVDTSIWIDHPRSGDEAIAKLLEAGRALAHPVVIGEPALGQLCQRKIVLAYLHTLDEGGREALDGVFVWRRRFN